MAKRKKAKTDYQLVEPYLDKDVIVPGPVGEGPIYSVASSPFALVNRMNGLMLPAVGRNTVLTLSCGGDPLSANLADSTDLVVQISRNLIRDLDNEGGIEGAGDFVISAGFGNERQEARVYGDAGFGFSLGQLTFGPYALPFPSEARVQQIKWATRDGVRGVSIKTLGTPVRMPWRVWSRYTVAFNDGTVGRVKLDMHRDVAPWEPQPERHPNRAITDDETAEMQEALDSMERMLQTIEREAGLDGADRAAANRP